MSYYFRDQSWVQMQEHLERRSLLILPVGTTEEHGPHLPVDTDARIAEAYGAALADALSPEVPLLLMDTIRYGYSMRSCAGGRARSSCARASSWTWSSTSAGRCSTWASTSWRSSTATGTTAAR